MQSAKKDVQALLDNLPDEATLEDIHYHSVRAGQIRRGEARAQTEGTLSQDDVETRLRRWITK